MKGKFALAMGLLLGMVTAGAWAQDDAKAKDILRKGIAETSSPDLQYLLDHYAEL